MSHGLEVSIDGFNAAFASRQEPAWHQLGTVFDGDVTTAEMLRLAHLAGWDVRLNEITVGDITEERFAVPQLAVVRTNPFDGQDDVLGFVGGRYNVYQNEELLAFGDNILDGGGRWETAGSIKNGRVVFASLMMDTFTIDPNGANDTVNNYLLVQSSHDGSTAVTAAVTPVRAVCQNTLAVALSSAKQTFKVRHTQSMDGRIAAAREALDITFTYQAEFENVANALYRADMNVTQFEKVLDKIAPVPDKDASKAAQTRWTNQRDKLVGIFQGTADGPDTAFNIAGTAWNGYNAVIESLDWYRTPRKGTAEGVAAAASGFDPVTNAAKNKAFRVFADFAGVKV